MSNELAIIDKAFRNKEYKHINEGEYFHLITSIDEHYNKFTTPGERSEMRLFLRVLWLTGARISEVIALQRKDIFYDGYERVHMIRWHTLKQRKKDVIDERPIKADLYDNIMQYCDNCQIKPDDRIFHWKTRFGAYKFIKNLGDKCGIRISPKSFRHGLAYDSLQKGIPLVDIKEALRHRNISSTMSYIHRTKRDLLESAEKRRG
jgi:integrase